MFKFCTTCKIERPFSDFTKQEHGKFGLRGYCKSCQRYHNRNSKTKPEWKRRWLIKQRVQTYLAYGGLRCNCCGERKFKFLTLDHVYNDGYKDRQKGGLGSGGGLYSKLRRLGYPDKDRYQILCMNCNFGKKMNKGICPHKM